MEVSMPRNENQDMIPMGSNANSNGMTNMANMADDNMMYMPAKMPELAGKAAAKYPDIYYKIQPHIMATCDHLDAYGMMMTKDVMDNTCDKLHEDILKMHPDMAYLDNENMTGMMPEARETISFGFDPPFGFDGRGFDGRGFDGRGFDGGFRRRGGGLRDIIGILLLSEFFRRRRHPFGY